MHALTLLGAAHAHADAPMLSPAVDGIRLILHVLGAAVWVGGQLTVAGLLPTIRGLGGEAPKKIAQAFGRVMWPAYALVVITGFWNVGAADVGGAPTAWKAVLIVKIVVVAASGIAVWLHQRATTKAGLAVWGAVGGLTSVAALCMGVFLAR